jgi:malate synthase
MTWSNLARLALLSAIALPLAAQQRAAANQTVASLQRQVKALTEERDALKKQVDEIPFVLRQENAELYRQLDEAVAQKEKAVSDRDQLEATLKENRSGGDSILRELQQARNDLRASNSRIEALEKDVSQLQSRLDDVTAVREGTLVHFGPDVIPAKCLNLRRMTPSVKKASGIVVINCLISEMGEPLEVQLIQPLPGEPTAWTEQAHQACLEAAKRLVFQPATNKDGVRLRVWQGVAFQLK